MFFYFFCTACNGYHRAEDRLLFCPACGMEEIVEINRTDFDAGVGEPLPLDPMEAELMEMEQSVYEARVSHHHSNW